MKKKRHDAATMGGRIKIARDFRGLKQKELLSLMRGQGADVGTEQALSNWENDKNVLSGKNIAILTEVLKINTRWLQSGEGAMLAGDSDLSQLDDAQGRKVPLIELEDFNVRKNKTNVTQLRPANVITHYPCGPRARAFTLSNRSMEPRMFKGDTIIIDPDVKPVPDDFIAVIIRKNISDEGAVDFVQFSYVDDGIKLAHLNKSHPTYTFTVQEFSEQVEVVGVMTERSEPRRQ